MSLSDKQREFTQALYQLVTIGCEQCRWSTLSEYSGALRCVAPVLPTVGRLAQSVRMDDRQCGQNRKWFEPLAQSARKS